MVRSGLALREVDGRASASHRARVSNDLARSFFATFAAVFLAELGDKTQLATMALAGAADTPRSRWLIFFAAASALVATSALGVLAGTLLSKWIRPQTIERAAGVLFVVLGAWMLFKPRS